MHVTDHDALAELLATNNPSVLLYDNLDPGAISLVGLIHAAVAVRRMSAHLDSVQARVFAALERLVRADDAGSSRGRGSIESELTATLHLPPATLRTLLAESGFLCERFPETLARLTQGLVSWRQVKPLLDLTSCMHDQGAREVQEVVLPQMGEHTPRTAYNRVQSAVDQVDPEGAAERHAQRAMQRCLQVCPEADGMATVKLFVKADHAQAIQAKVNAVCAKRVRGDQRTLDQRRADAAVDLLLSGGGEVSAPAAMVHLVVNVESLIGLDDTPAQLEGYGSITPGQARALVTAPGSELRRLFVDSGGRLVSVDPRKYRPGAQLVRHLQALNRTCSFKGCTMPARRCDIDHMHAFGDGGCTCEENLHPACRDHHNQKTAGLWTVHREGRAIVWTSTRTGRRYISYPEPYPVPRHHRDRKGGGKDNQPGFWPRS